MPRPLILSPSNPDDSRTLSCITLDPSDTFHTYKVEILLPSEAGVLEAEGMEETWRFTQKVLNIR
jgi:hypothetical protein